jgi:6-phosphogluconolactonase
MKNKIEIFKNTNILSKFFLKKLVNGIEQIPTGSYFSMALSGGSTPKHLFQYLASHSGDKINWGKVRIFWGDERCVSPESKESNYLMTKENLLDHIPIPPENIFRIKGEDDPLIESDRYAQTVSKHVNTFGNIPQFDIIMLGLGDDGHTASIFPDKSQLFNSNKLFEVAEHPQTKQIRISATGQIINNAKTVIFLVTGASKAQVLAKVIDKKDEWESFPASKVHPKNGDLFWFVDELAAARLSVKEKE